MKRFVAALLLLVLPLVCSTAPAVADSGGILIDGKHVQLASAPTVVGGVVMLPVRDVVQALGGKVFWEAGAHKAVLQTREHRVELVPGQATARVESQQVPLSAPVTLQGGRMLAPAGFLLALYGDRLQIHDPRLIAPAAVALLGQVQIPANFDFSLTTQVTTDMIGRPPAVPAPPPGGTPATVRVTGSEMQASADGFVRGHDALINLGDAMFSPESGRMERLRLAVRDGHAYTRFGGKWEAMLGKPEGTLPLDVAALLSMRQSVREAHLGLARVVEGHKLQDVVVTLDPSLLDRAFAGGLPLGAAPPPGPVYQSMACTVTLDGETNQLRGFALDMVLLAKDPMVGNEMGVHLELHLAGRLAPDATPIVWPRDLPYVEM